MRLKLECLPCFLRQVLEATKMAGLSDEQKEEVMIKAIEIIRNFKSYTTPPELAKDIHGMTKVLCKDADPYKPLKKKSIEIAKEVVKDLIENGLKGSFEDRLRFSIKLSGVGNTFDAGVYSIAEFEKVVSKVKEELEKDFKIWEFDKFLKTLEGAKRILIVGDNAGETVFDAVLAKVLGEVGEVYYGVRAEPIINDATLEDAIDSGLDEVAKVISTGCSLPGVKLELCNQEFVDLFWSSDVVISKGQGNFEGLSEVKKPGLFFLLKAKCPVIASHIGVGVGNYVFLSYI